MHIKFLSITITRFRSFLKTSTFYFDQGVSLNFLKGKNEAQPALGSNGSGKSSIIDAMLWCLYGSTVQGLRGPDVIPWSGKGRTEVEIIVEVDGKKHSIIRTANPNLLTLDSTEGSQGDVEKLLPIPAEVIPYTIIIGQHQPLFFDLKAAEKLKVFSEALDLDRWETRSAHASELTKQLAIEITQGETELGVFESQLITLVDDLKILTEKKSKWETERELALKGKDDEKKKLEKKLSVLQPQRDNADLALDRAETELRAINRDIDKLRSSQTALQQEHFKATRKHDTAVTDKKRFENERDHLKDESCPTCKQAIKDKRQLSVLLNDIEVKIGALDIKQLKKYTDDCMAAVERATLAIQEQQESGIEFEKAADAARDTLDHLSPQIAQLKADIRAIDSLKAEYENQNNPFGEQVNIMRRRKNLLEETITKAHEALNKKKEYAERVKPWIKGFKDIKLLTITDILQELELATNSMLQEFGLHGWEVKYDIERETKSKTISSGLNIVILSPDNTKPVRWEVWSGGEAQRLKLIGSAALSSVLLNHIGVSTNLEIYDEPTESLSKEGVEDLVELLAYRSREAKKSVWLIDHHLIESAHFKNVVTVTKTKSGSSVD